MACGEITLQSIVDPEAPARLGGLVQLLASDMGVNGAGLPGAVTGAVGRGILGTTPPSGLHCLLPPERTPDVGIGRPLDWEASDTCEAL